MDVGKALQALGSEAAASLEADRAIKANILQYLRDGHLAAFGFEAPRQLRNSATGIPRDAWTGIVQWDKSHLDYQGIQFIEVRVMPAHWEEELTKRWHVKFAPAAPVKTRGPEGTARQIAEAYTALREAGQVEFNASMQRLYPAVRRWLKAHYPEAGFSDTRPHDETLRKTVSPLFSEDRSKRSR